MFDANMYVEVQYFALAVAQLEICFRLYLALPVRCPLSCIEYE